MKLIDLTGKIFGKWTVLGCDLDISDRTFWLCRCACGNEKSILGYTLTSDLSQSCGCRRSFDPGNPGSAYNRLFKAQRRTAKRRNLEWDISYEEYLVLALSDCYYCNSAPSNIFNYLGYQFAYTGIDRVRNGLGYLPENCVPSCKRCNIAKSDMSVSEFVNWLKAISLNLDKIERLSLV